MDGQTGMDTGSVYGSGQGRWPAGLAILLGLLVLAPPTQVLALNAESHRGVTDVALRVLQDTDSEA